MLQPFAPCSVSGCTTISTPKSPNLLRAARVRVGGSRDHHYPVVRELVVRLESLDEQHELYAVAAELRRVADASVQAASD
ncbi:MAG: hypothetical protein COZ06_19160 [Armatimonadetes bacterium CG_4_10_14_3_um_filter_66_18]|nr:MAG: hypothetical protein COZ06_19160 [Armatimonadetes bacterium CG_4_10_14_3_um_filter_66_18]